MIEIDLIEIMRFLRRINGTILICEVDCSKSVIAVE